MSNRSSQPSVYVKTLGCKVNTYDSDALETQFILKGYQIVSDPQQADISIVNTCSVTANADREARYILRRLRRSNPKALVVATGCYAQTDSERLIGLEDVDLVFPNEVKDRVAEVADDQLKLRKQGKVLDAPKIPNDVKAVAANKQGHFKTSLTMTATDSQKTRAFLKIQDGCNGFCTYCLIPYARGASRSVKRAEVLTEVRRLIDKGVKEIVFTGIHIGDYGSDHQDQKGFVSLVQELFDWPDMVRLRISSLEPGELPESLLQALSTRSELFCDHFHLPLQAGHDRILKLMRRSYSSQQYADTVAMTRDYFPLANIGADIIPGFPSESEDDFLTTVEFIKTLNLNYLHVFPYSPRPNTAAIKMPNHIPVVDIKSRAKRLREISEAHKSAYYRTFIGKELEVLWEKDRDQDGRSIGHSLNYLPVVAPSGTGVTAGTISTIKVKGFVANSRMLGLPIN